MSNVFEWSESQRQPVSAIWLIVLKSIGKVVKGLWPLVLVMLFNSKKEGNSTLDLVLIIVPVLVLIISLSDYLYFKFSVCDSQLLVNKGIFAKKNIVLPLSKIQSVHIEQNWLHKLLDLAEVSFDSPGSAEAEVKINLSKDQAESLKAFITDLTPISETDLPGAAKINIAQLSFSDLARLGISANHLETLVIVLGLGVSFFNNIKEILEDQYKDLFSLTTSDLLNSDVFFIMYLIIGIMIVSVIGSFIRILVKYANFIVSTTENGLSIQGGLINTTEKAVPFKKIQFISWKTNWVRKKLPIYLLEYHSIGSPQTNQKLKVKIPVTSEALLNALVDIYHPVSDDDQPVTKISKKYILRTTLIRGVAPFLVLSAFSSFFIGVKALLLAVIPVYVFVTSWFFFKKFQIRSDSEILHVRAGVFGHAETILKWKNIQSVKVLQSVYQRRHHLATLKIFTAGGSLTIPFITIEEARHLQNYALYKLESSPSGWM